MGVPEHAIVMSQRQISENLILKTIYHIELEYSLSLPEDIYFEKF